MENTIDLNVTLHLRRIEPQPGKLFRHTLDLIYSQRIGEEVAMIYRHPNGNTLFVRAFDQWFVQDDRAIIRKGGSPA